MSRDDHLGEALPADAEPGELHVLVNLTWLVPGVVGGSEESTTDSLRAVLDHDASVRLTLAVHPGFAASHPDLAAACRCHPMRGVGTGRGTPSKFMRVLGEQTWLAWLTRRCAPDVVHHAGGVLPVVHPGATVLTIHDLQPLDIPANFSVVKQTYLRAMLGRSARGAGHICVPSGFTARRVEELLGVDATRISVVPWSVVRGSRPRPAVAGAPDHPLFLYPAITHPHKNHLMLLEAFAHALFDLPDAELVLPGGAGSCEREVLERIDRSDLRGRVRRPGRLGSAEMEDLYARATAVVVPSLYEGFGLPALEAMVMGVPLVSSSAGSLREVTSIDGSPVTAVPPVDPSDASAWATAMVAVGRLGDGTRRSVIDRQRSAAARFTPAVTAAALVGAYRRVAVPHVSSRR